MLRHTFIHLPGIGPVTERQLWGSGVTTWQDFLGLSSLPARLQCRLSELRGYLVECDARLHNSDAAYFDRSLPGGERWRIYADFRHKAAFLDIETTGVSAQYGYITMVGVLDSEGYTPYVHGENLAELRSALEKYELVVTFNGAAFDLPFIEYHFGDVFRSKAHIDLRFPLRRLGYKGGLKRVEVELGAARPSQLSGLDGYDAVLLWRMWQRGNDGAKATLVRYNAEDVASLPALADFVYSKLASRLPFQTAPLEALPRPEIDLPYDLEAIRRVRQMRDSWGVLAP